MNIGKGCIILAFLPCLCNVLAATSCTSLERYQGCACQMSDTEEVVGLDYLITNDTQKRIPRFVTYDNIEWYYAFHPCSSFDMFLGLQFPNIPCTKASAARFTNESVDTCENLGSFTDSEFGFDNNYAQYITSNLTLTYRNKLTSNGMVVSLVCNGSVEPENSVFKYINVDTGVLPTYYFSLTSKCCCPGVCTKGVNIPKKSFLYWYYIAIGGGVLLLIILIIFMYFKISAKCKSYKHLK